jgi:ribonuclease HI
MDERIYQLSFLAPEPDIAQPVVSHKKKHTWWLYIDGAARNNPGPASVGIYIVKDGIPHFHDGCYLGTRTNNQAEYLALLFGLFTLQSWIVPEDRVEIFSDSQLLVRQLHGIYKIKNIQLKPLFVVAHQVIQQMRATISHIPREENTHADHMANESLDTKKIIPSSFVTFLRRHEIDI